MNTCFEVVGDGETLLGEFETLGEAKAWARRYIKTENAGGYDTLSCNAVPFEGDHEFFFERGEEY